ncbi:MFS transporter [Priestia endophytica]|uniref:MFS transporter n=1 Tax=Priestia endophytica TaxID=135735 RepID=UPI000DCA8F19|nr:MFS transporter [Priestia endophytica]
MTRSINQVAQSYIHSPNKRKKLYKRTLLIVGLSQMFAGAGLAAGITVGALLAQQMLGTEAGAGLPTAIFNLGSAGAALIVGWLSQRYGRRTGLATGFIAGGIGAIGVIIAAVINSLFLLFISLFIYGAGTATNLQARYAGTDLASPKQRATAVSMAMVFTTFGAVAGPNLVGITGKLALAMNVPELTGPFILAAFAYILAGLIFSIMLRPDPLLIARAIEANKQEHDIQANPIPYVHKTNKRGVAVGAIVMVVTQIVMFAIMTMTPVHMQHHGHDLDAVGIVIGAHIGLMYLPSLITGVLIDRIGRNTMTIAAGVTLLFAGLVAAMAPGNSMFFLILSLSLLGLGWNLGLISGTAQIVDSTDPSTRAKTQGTVDVLIALAGAAGGVLSGVIVAHFSYAILSLGGGILCLVLIPLVVLAKENKEKNALKMSKEL